MDSFLTVLAFVLNLKQAAATTNFPPLCVHLTLNVLAINLRRRKADAAEFPVLSIP
jgi:hypothetical protein